MVFQVHLKHYLLNKTLQWGLSIVLNCNPAPLSSLISICCIWWLFNEKQQWGTGRYQHPGYYLFLGSIQLTRATEQEHRAFSNPLFSYLPIFPPWLLTGQASTRGLEGAFSPV